MWRFLVALLLALGLPYAAHAQIYICPTQAQCINNASPSDANPGTFASPKQTFSAGVVAARTATPKKLILEPGTYTLSGNISLTTSDNNVTWAAYPGATPVVSGGGSPAAANPYILATGAVTGLTVKGITFQNLGDDAGHNGSFQFQSGGTSSLTFQYNTFVNCSDFCLNFPSTSNLLVDSNTATNVIRVGGNGGAAFFLWNGGHHNDVISHNLCQYTGTYCAAMDNGTGTAQSTNITFDSNISINSCTAVGDCGAYYMDDRPYLQGNGMTGGHITNNVASGVGQGSTKFTDFGTSAYFCIYMDDVSGNTDISGNLCYNDPGTAAIEYHGGSNITVHNNVFVMAPGTIVGYYIGNATWCPGGVTCPMTGNTFQNNVVRFLGAVNTQNNSGTFYGPWAFSVTSQISNYVTISGNLYYLDTGGSFQNIQTNPPSISDTSPIICGPSMGGTLAGGVAATQLWQSIANGVISSWLPLAMNQGPMFRNCSTGF